MKKTTAPVAPAPGFEAGLYDPFFVYMSACGYHPSAIAQLWAEANPTGSYGIFLAGARAGRAQTPDQAK